ncbi:MAG: hypothetical protein H6842_13630 [Rhodospirillaceae bacterium]|nr:hypothetical protein [Rhodospirillaceae bacterium]
MRVSKCIVLGAAALLLPLASGANEFDTELRTAYQTHIVPLLSQGIVIDAILAQNADHAGLTDADVEALDQQWRQEAEAGSGPLIDAVLGNALSEFLAQVKADSDGMITEIFVMDNRGLNVAQSDVTSDYMQGDEAKWLETFPVGGDAVFVDELEFDESTNAFQSQVSGSIVDPATGETIGAITVGVNVESLL